MPTLAWCGLYRWPRFRRNRRLSSRHCLMLSILIQSLFYAARVVVIAIIINKE